MDPRATPRRHGCVPARPSPPGSTVTLGIGQSATCTITNDDIAAHLTLAEGSHQRQRRHRGRYRLDVERGRPDNGDLRRDRHRTGDGCPGAAGPLRAVRERSRPARLRGAPLGVHRRGGERRTSVTRRHWAERLLRDRQRRPARAAHARQTMTNDNGGTRSRLIPTRRDRCSERDLGTGRLRVGDERRAGLLRPSESGPAGYTASTWSCVGGTQTGASIASGSRIGRGSRMPSPTR